MGERIEHSQKQDFKAAVHSDRYQLPEITGPSSCKRKSLVKMTPIVDTHGSGDNKPMVLSAKVSKVDYAKKVEQLKPINDKKLSVCAKEIQAKTEQVSGQAMLPIELKRHVISDMKVGETSWTTAWAMQTDKRGNYSLNGHYTAYETPGGTVDMRVTRTKDGYAVDTAFVEPDRRHWDASTYVGEAPLEPVYRMDNHSVRHASMGATVKSISAYEAVKSLGGTVTSKRVPGRHDIAGMKVGESGWTVPWAMYADKQGRMWLNSGYELENSPGGTVQMFVCKEKTGIIADVKNLADPREWYPSNPHYAGDFKPVPVMKLEYKRTRL